MNIEKHKVFISYFHADDQNYKDILLRANKLYGLFDDYSVHEDDVDDTGLTDEQVRRIIRDDYIQDATVLILLCGQNTKHRKHIDWEIHAAMYDSDINPKMGILVINLPTISNKQGMIACGNDEEQVMGNVLTTWIPIQKDVTYIENNYPYLPNRIVTNLARNNVSISVVNWNVIENDYEKLKYLIDNAFNRRKNNDYDHSEPLRRRNS
jgi:hypothetical protein